MEEIMMNKNNYTNLEFTELTLVDKMIHENLYTELLLAGCANGFRVNVSMPYYPIIEYYNQKELQKAKELFCKTFE